MEQLDDKLDDSS